MKRYKFLALLSVVGILTISSCEKDLDIPSEASLSATAPLATEDVDKLLTGLYSSMMAPSDYGFFNIMMTEIMSDNYQPVKFQWYQVQNFYEHVVPADDILLTRFYRHYYNGIDRANTIINVPSSSKNQIAKARYCRALSYLRLYDLYEEVPLVDEKYDKKPIAPSSKTAVLAFIINDLKYAKENCNHIDAANLSTSQITPTSEAASALLARVYRMNGDIVSAGKEAEELITSGKFTLAANPAEYTNEVIMKFAGYKPEENGSWGWVMSPSAKTWNCFAAEKGVTDLVQGTDTRAVLFDFAGQVANAGYIYSTKYSPNDDSDLLISRIAEMYLISAEAGNASRLAEFQAVRQSSLSLANERRLELSFEWVRWSDLKLLGETYKLPYPQAAVDSNPLLSN